MLVQEALQDDRTLRDAEGIHTGMISRSFEKDGSGKSEQKR